MNEPFSPPIVHQEGQATSLLPPIVQAHPEGLLISPLEQGYIHDTYGKVLGAYTRFLGPDFPPPLVNQITVDINPGRKQLSAGYVIPTRSLHLETPSAGQPQADIHVTTGDEAVLILPGPSGEGVRMQLPRRLADIILISHELGHAVYENALASQAVLPSEQYDRTHPSLHTILSEGFATFMGDQFLEHLIQNPAEMGLNEGDIPYLQRYLLRRDVSFSRLRATPNGITGTLRNYSDGNDIFSHLYEEAQQKGADPFTALRTFLGSINPMTERITQSVNSTDATYTHLVQQGTLAEWTAHITS